MNWLQINYAIFILFISLPHFIIAQDTFTESYCHSGQEFLNHDYNPRSIHVDSYVTPSGFVRSVDRTHQSEGFIYRSKWEYVLFSLEHSVTPEMEEQKSIWYVIVKLIVDLAYLIKALLD